MQQTLKRNAVLVAGLAVFFWWAFSFAKHNPALRGIIPFGEDPYDSVSSFAVIASLLLALVSSARAFFPQRVGRSGQPIYTLRAQLAVPFCVLVTVAAEAVAMARHSSMWLYAPACGQLLAVLAAQIGFALATLSFVSKSSNVKSLRALRRPAAVWLGTLLALAVYPERLILGTAGHLATVVFGSFLLFAPVSALIKAWLPEPPEPAGFSAPRRSPSLRYTPFAVAAAIGFVVGACACFGELGEGSVHPAVTQILFVAGVYVTLGASGLLIGYATLGRLLGFVITESRPQQSA